MSTPNAKETGIALIYRPLADLAAENKPHYAGQVIFAIDGLGKIGMKIGDWDWKTVAEAAATKFNDLGWFIAPEQGGSARLNVFAVVNTDPEYAFIPPDASHPVGRIVITDLRLRGKKDYPVASTQYGGGVFRKDQLIYNDAIGNVTLLTDELAPGEQIWITLPMGLAADPGIQALIARVVTLEYLTAPLAIVGGGMMLWQKPVGQIPAGWQEVVNWRGRLLMCYDPPAGASPGYPVGSTGGSATHTNTEDEMFPHAHKGAGEELYDDYHDNDRTDNGAQVGKRTFLETEADLYSYRNALTDKRGGVLDAGTGKKVAKPYSILNPYRVAMFIEPIPGYVIP